MRTPSIGITAIFLLTIVFLLFALRSRRQRVHAPRGPAVPPPPAPPKSTPFPQRPVFNASQFILAIPLFWILLPLWALSSLGDLIAAPFQLVGAVLSSGIALFFSIIGVDSHGTWSKAGRLYAASGRSIANIFGRLLATFGFGGVVDRLKRPAPPAVAETARPPSVTPSGERTFPFEDEYRIESHLGTGGSTARLFVVRRVQKNQPVGDRLVLKYFDMDFGSRLEEVIRESRGMQLAKEMGIVIDHRLAEDHFYYVMPYYEGETLTRAAARIHRHLRAEDELAAEDIRTCLTWLAEILRTLDGYHRHGVIHKDVKPDNVIVTEDGVRIVDLGLLTPLTSALTLTTHGTEYFRDPEMVKMSVAGKRVKDVDAVRFDVYSSGAVLYYLIEGSFPACGPLSRFSRPVPMALSWIVSRAMAEGEKRYPGMPAMRADLDAAIRLLDEGELADAPVSRLPSFTGFDATVDVEPPPPPPSLPPMSRTAAPARSVKPMRMVRRPRTGRGWGVAAMLIGFFAAFVVFVSIYAWRTTPAPPPEPVPHAARLPEGIYNAWRLEKVVRDWSNELLAAPHGIPAAELAAVPLLFVGEGRDRVLDSVRTAESELMQERPIHPSATLENSLKEILVPGVTPQEVQRFLLEKLADDTLPIVVWVREKPAQSENFYFVEVRFFYRGMFRYYVGSVHTGGRPSEPDPDKANRPDFGRNPFGDSE